MTVWVSGRGRDLCALTSMIAGGTDDEPDPPLAWTLLGNLTHRLAASRKALVMEVGE